MRGCDLQECIYPNTDAWDVISDHDDVTGQCMNAKIWSCLSNLQIQAAGNVISLIATGRIIKTVDMEA